jgi:uncharacterized coiled-coil DUF342 family protein
MSIGEREGLIARIRQIRKASAARNAPEPRSTPVGEHSELEALEARIVHLEQMVQGFQDSVHRESQRQGKRIAELEAAIQPAALGRALSQDARERGL